MEGFVVELRDRKLLVEVYELEEDSLDCVEVEMLEVDDVDCVKSEVVEVDSVG